MKSHVSMSISPSRTLRSIRNLVHLPLRLTDLTCKLCSTIAWAPTQCGSCGRLFCYDCIVRYTRSFHACLCGHSFFPAPCRETRARLASLCFVCPNFGCGQLVPYNRTAGHNRSCRKFSFPEKAVSVSYSSSGKKPLRTSEESLAELKVELRKSLCEYHRHVLYHRCRGGNGRPPCACSRATVGAVGERPRRRSRSRERETVSCICQNEEPRLSMRNHAVCPFVPENLAQPTEKEGEIKKSISLCDNEAELKEKGSAPRPSAAPRETACTDTREEPQLQPENALPRAQEETKEPDLMLPPGGICPAPAEPAPVAKKPVTSSPERNPEEPHESLFDLVISPVPCQQDGPEVADIQRENVANSNENEEPALSSLFYEPTVSVAPASMDPAAGPVLPCGNLISPVASRPGEVLRPAESVIPIAPPEDQASSAAKPQTNPESERAPVEEQQDLGITSLFDTATQDAQTTQSQPADNAHPYASLQTAEEETKTKSQQISPTNSSSSGLAEADPLLMIREERSPCKSPPDLKCRIRAGTEEEELVCAKQMVRSRSIRTRVFPCAAETVRKRALSGGRVRSAEFVDTFLQSKVEGLFVTCEGCSLRLILSTCCRQCDNCSRKLCNRCESRCQTCSAVFCPTCNMTLACAQCSLTVCKKLCSVACTTCGKPICSKRCSISCRKCRQSFLCTDCVVKCSHCSELFCGACCSLSCSVCHSPVCSPITCEGCGTSFCPACAKTLVEGCPDCDWRFVDTAGGLTVSTDGKMVSAPIEEQEFVDAVAGSKVFVAGVHRFALRIEKIQSDCAGCGFGICPAGKEVSVKNMLGVTANNYGMSGTLSGPRRRLKDGDVYYVRVDMDKRELRIWGTTRETDLVAPIPNTEPAGYVPVLARCHGKMRVQVQVETKLECTK